MAPPPTAATRISIPSVDLNKVLAALPPSYISEIKETYPQQYFHVGEGIGYQVFGEISSVKDANGKILKDANGVLMRKSCSYEVKMQETGKPEVLVETVKGALVLPLAGAVSATQAGILTITAQGIQTLGQPACSGGLKKLLVTIVGATP